MKQPWQEFTISPERSHHLFQGRPAYSARFEEVLKFHAPGLAPVRDSSGAYHILADGSPAYSNRYLRTFGFYEGRAAVCSLGGWFHILENGQPLYPDRYDWCGNFQEGRSAVRTWDGQYFHIRPDGTKAYESGNIGYRYVGDYREGIAVVQREDGRHAHITLDGRPQHQRCFRDLDVFHKGFARARDDRGWHHINLQGEPAYGRRFAAVEPFYNGQARVEDFDGALLVIDEAGETIVQLRSPEITSPPSPPSLEITSPEGDALQELSADMVGYWRSQTIFAAVKLGVFDALPATSAAMEQKLGLASGMGERLLRALHELGLVFPRVSPRGANFWQTSDRGALLATNHPLSMASAAVLWGSEHYAAWASLAAALREGKPAFDTQFGLPFFDWYGQEPEKLKTYHQALLTYVRHDYSAITEAIDFSDFSDCGRSDRATVLDAGGGTGELLWMVLQASPRSTGILLDRPEAIANVRVPENLATRVQIVGADLFASWSTLADAVILARVLHDWSDPQAKIILQRAKQALTPKGRLYILERVLEPSVPDCGLLDLNMLVITGGCERTLPQFQDLLRSVGLRFRQQIKMRSGISVLIASMGNGELGGMVEF
ncbi:MAG: WG repeat-containing protein [Hormoscilla sp. GM102CHS1]|nr:WG repeat-containing protein [Hormoscilla sp. GM102CHS1]